MFPTQSHLYGLQPFDKLQELDHGNPDDIVDVVDEAAQVGQHLLHEDVGIVVPEDGGHALHHTHPHLVAARVHRQVLPPTHTPV